MSVFKKKKKLVMPSTLYVVKHEEEHAGEKEKWYTVHETLAEVAAEIKEGELFAEYSQPLVYSLSISREVA